MRTKPNDILGVHLAEPLAVVADLGLVAVENFENLLKVSFRIGLDLLARKRRARFRYARGVANHRREIANQENGGVAQVLKMLQFAHHHGVPEMKIRSRGIHAEINTQRPTRLARRYELCNQLRF